MYKFSQKIRTSILEQIFLSGESHIGSCFSIVDILTVLYLKILNIRSNSPTDPSRDRFILSKGHSAAAVYAVLAETGFITKENLQTFCQNGSMYQGHASHHIPGIEFSTGSLGHGLPVGCGIALSGARESKNFKIYVLLSDGELQEGSNWESILFAAHHKLSNLTAIIDYNRIQSLGHTKDICNLDNLSEKFKAFGWEAIEVDGHNFDDLIKAFAKLDQEKPKAIIARTIKGKGVSFMENNLTWHYKNPNSEEYELAKLEIMNVYETTIY